MRERELLERLIKAVGDCEDTQAVLAIAREAKILLEMDGLQEVVLSRGNVVHVNGIPLRLKENTILLGHPANISMATGQNVPS